MLKSFAKAHVARRGAKVLPGGWVTVALLSPKGRALAAAAARRGWREVEKRRVR